MTEIIMTWQQKMHALNKLSPCILTMKVPDNWSVYQQGIEVKTDIESRILKSPQGIGISPQHAIDNYWTELMKQIIIKNATGENRKAYKWDEFMWTEINEKQ